MSANSTRRYVSRRVNVATHVSFSGHETFVFRYGWLKKAVDAVHDDQEIFNRESAMVTLGVGKNMVRSIRHWALATRVLDEKPGTRGRQLRVTPFGEILFGKNGHDLYLEDINSLWLLHWQLATNESRSTTWSWAFNVFSSNEFTRDIMLDAIQAEIPRRFARSPGQSSIRRDVDCFIRTYTPVRRGKSMVLEDSLDCPLVELNLVEEDSIPGFFRFRRGPQRTLSDSAFVYALMAFWSFSARDRQTLSFTEIAYNFASPGRVFKLDENSLAERLDRLGQLTAGCLVYSQTAGLNQVYRRSEFSAEDLLGRHYNKFDHSMLVGV